MSGKSRLVNFCRNTVGQSISGFCENSSIHGVHYLTDRKRSWFEKIFWAIVITCVLYVCGSLIQTVWNKWNKTPVVVTFSDRSTSVWNVPLPTLTICPDIKTNRTKYDFTEKLREFENFLNNGSKEWPKEEKFLLNAVSQVCEFKFAQMYELGLEHINESFKNTLIDLSPTFSEMIAGVTWRGVNHTWEDMFDLILTERGICFTFNFLNASDIYREDVLFEDVIVQQNGQRSTKWNIGLGYNGEAKDEIFPYRTFNAYIKYGLQALFVSYLGDIDKTCNEGDEGFKISIDTPGDIPQLSKYYYSLPFNQEILIDVTPEMIIASDNTAEYLPEIRRCYFPSEKELRYFKIYTQSNCEFECLTNYTLHECGCVRFHMPRIAGTLICAEDKVPCYQKAKQTLMESLFKKDHLRKNDSTSSILDCNCMPPCKSLTYRVEITQAKMGSNLSKFLEMMDFKSTLFKIYFKDGRFWAKHRTKFYGFIDFVANAGGLFGLFMGISAISFVEILYFFFIRIWRK